MNENDALSTVIADLDAAIESLEKNASASSSDCVQACATAYNSCLENAGSIAEKAVCKGAYNRCLANC